MNATDFASVLGPVLSTSLAKKGYTELTAVQEAVLAPNLFGSDLRITSQTGSGKTVAIGFALRELALSPSPSAKGAARPRALVVAPTRELARQIDEELRWLYSGSSARLASVTGGASYREEHRALAGGPSVVIGTPGRLLDHLQRGAIDASGSGAIVLDEADRMLDMGFRDELDGIFDLLPDDHRTHLVSATFPRDVQALADRVQQDAAHVEGTRLGAANVDIDHVIHVVEPRQRFDALVNLLLSGHDEQTLVFTRTRADVSEIADDLSAAGFAVAQLSGDMDQSARNRALAGFKRGELHVLVATDVAARGIDVQDIGRVIHLDVPTNADSYTHRSGRTGRAGRRGISALIAIPSTAGHAVRLLRRAGVAYRMEPIPTAAALSRAADDRIFQELTRATEGEVDPRLTALAKRLMDAGDVERSLTRLLGETRYAGPAPREIQPAAAREPKRAPSLAGPKAHPRAAGSWVAFRVSWGANHGADTRRLLAMACRRGAIAGKDVGSIRVEPTYSVVDVATHVAASFAIAAARPDPRDPRVAIRKEYPAHGPKGAPAPARKLAKKRN